MVVVVNQEQIEQLVKLNLKKHKHTIKVIVINNYLRDSEKLDVENLVSIVLN